jgi:hypothetical protein
VIYFYVRIKPGSTSRLEATQSSQLELEILTNDTALSERIGFLRVEI